MKRLFASWFNSFIYLFALPFYEKVGAALARALPCMGLSVAAFTCVALVAALRIPYISSLLASSMWLYPPLLAMISSPLYIPFLVAAVSPKEAPEAEDFWHTVRLSFLIYAGIAALLGLIYFAYFEGSPTFFLGLVSVLTAAVMLFFIKLFSFPIASVAVFFRPMRTRRSSVIWRHARIMTWRELPGVIGVFLLTFPFSYACYWALSLAVSKSLLGLYNAHVLMHGCNIVLWQLGWIFFMVFYQERKKAYLPKD